ncbi:allophanate hydrolase [Terrihabitans soli]|uniref:Allophanate hydrolase n=1 Tax=Terrihabitans soli TaxID=708113 RepID=A0A6S6QVY2_9HYPH|nr:biotin-dependent carboxyltransferase family protein [Terrihabitans soli]BCJ92097.1 allophanate hydrolase [Terrihabitans soli]
MSAGFHIVQGGLQTTLQDGGRTGLLALGVPHSGALDPLSFRLSNRIVGNDANSAALELRSPGPVLRFEGKAGRIALAGTSVPLLVERKGTVQEWPAWRAVDLQDGDVVSVSPFADTAVAYLAALGGFDVPEQLGSRSTFLRGGFGGLDGKPLQTGGVLKLLHDGAPDAPCHTLLRPPSFVASPVLRALPGPQADYFKEEAQSAFFGRPFTVSRDLDRMGMRLDGPVLAHSKSADIASDATVPGAVQVPGSSQPILLLNDCQTTGGYPKIAVVITADLFRAGRLMPGHEIRFRKVTMTEAEEARAEAAHAYRSMANTIVPVRAGVQI